MSVFSARYARAFTDVIFSAKLSFPEVDRQLSDFAATLDNSPELRELMSNPAFQAEQKVAILDRLNEKLGLAPQVRNFVAVLINHDRLAVFDEVLADFRREMNASLGISEVEVLTARKLDDAERRQMEEQVGQLAGTRVQAKFEEDSSLLGGAVVRIGSTVYDGSVRGQLQRLKEELVAG